MKQLIRVIDLETTGLTAEDSVVEIGSVDVDANELQITSYVAELVKPEKKIPPEAMAIHHITNEMVGGSPAWADVWPRFLQPFGTETDIIAFAAHRADFDGQWLTTDKRSNKPLICTWKCAMRRWPDAPGFSNQCLRYLLDIQLTTTHGPPHRALPDAYVTAHILIELLKGSSAQELVQWSQEPAVYPTINFGKHNGLPWSEVPADYLDWMSAQESMDADIKWNAQRELKRRADVAEQEKIAGRAAYVALAVSAAGMAATLADLNDWYQLQGKERAKWGIIAGTSEYLAIVNACKERKAELSKMVAV